MATSMDIPAELICPLWRDEFEDPVISQCHHSFCRNCITEWIRHITSRRRPFICPLCKSVNNSDTEPQKSLNIEQLRDLLLKQQKLNLSVVRVHCKNMIMKI